MFRRLLIVALATFLSGVPAIGQEQIEKNVVYGMFSGTALLMDVYRPARPNGFGVVAIPGSGWSSRLGYGARALKDAWSTQAPRAATLVAEGYTVCVINHRATPVVPRARTW